MQANDATIAGFIPYSTHVSPSVVKTTGAINILTILMNPSPNGFMATACSGASKPNTTPSQSLGITPPSRDRIRMSP